MSYIFSRALVEEYSPASYSGTDASAPSNVNPTPKPCLWHARTTEPSRLSRFGMTCALFEASLGEALLTSFVEDSRARTSARPATATASTASAPDSGAKWPESSVRYDRDSHSWKTAHCLWDEVLPWSSVTLPTWGMTRNGSVYRHPTAERPIAGIESGLWATPSATDGQRGGCITAAMTGISLVQQINTPKRWPTPLASDGAKGWPNQRGGKGDLRLPSAVHQKRTWPTATATASKGWSPNHNRADTDDRLDYSVERASFQPGQQTQPMRLNPEWVEWLIGWPIGHTGLKPLATGRYQEWLRQHGGF